MADVLTPFQSLAEQSPVQNNRIAQGLQAARATNLQQQVANAPVGGSTVQGAQQLGAQQAAQAGAINLQTSEQTVQQQQKIGQQALAAQAGAAQLALGQKQLITKQRSLELTNKLAQIDQNLKNKLLDESISFEKDDMQRTLFNERQLMDYKIQSTKSDIELQAYEQQMTDLSNRRTTMLQLAYKKIQQTLEQGQVSGEQKLSEQQHLRLTQAAMQLKQKLAREAARQKNRAAMFTAGGTVLGAVAGTVVGGPGAGTAAGASLGGAAGSIAASQE